MRRLSGDIGDLAEETALVAILDKEWEHKVYNLAPEVDFSLRLLH